MLNLLGEHLDIWTAAPVTKANGGRGRVSAANRSPYGIKKLRELILELAVRGMLVAQHPDDEPASVLLGKIAKEKARLIKEGKVKKQKSLPEIRDEEKPFDLPKGWEWARLGDIAVVQAGFAFKSTHFNEDGDGLPLIRIRDVGQPFTNTYYSGEYKEEFLVKTGDYLVGMDGQFRVASWVNELALLNQRVARLIFFYDVLGQRFIAEGLQARLAELQGVKAYTTVDHLSGKQISEAVIALPPLAEQHRIVAKVDELMALCDRLERQQADSSATHQTLVETLLATLTAAPDHQEFAESWQRIAIHFDTLFTTEESIDQLKQTILQLAVLGKLVLQDPNDEPASVLLEKIVKEKARLIKEGKIRKETPLPKITEEEESFDIPKGWAFTRFENIVNITSGVTKGRKLAGRKVVSVPYLRVANVQRGFLGLGMMKEIEIPKEELEKFTVVARDLLVTEGGDWDKVGRTAIWKGELPLVAHQNHVFKARLIIEEQNEFWLEKYLNSFIAREYFANSSKQTTNLASINKTQLRGCIVPMPPLAEQHRIVAKVDELMALCDQLKAKLTQSQEQSEKLIDAMSRQSLVA